MFFIVRISDSIPLNPNDFCGDFVDRTIIFLKNKYVDKVLPNVGLVVALYDIVSLREAIVQRLDGKTLMKLTFRIVVFKPFEGEILSGRITSADAFGLSVSVGFFDDIRIPCTKLHAPTNFDEVEQAWCWRFNEYNMYYDIGDTVRFRVSCVNFPELKHDGPKDIGLEEDQEAVMSIQGSMTEDGMGPPAWWS
eukprot:GDKJ01056612.1.p1 GENE.GDKJ01056612.1~~GDKJ01056612.1.p1  ORF type:complete len:193 (+),score=33.16 GDKJ01056612.1:85-663(+)